MKTAHSRYISGVIVTKAMSPSEERTLSEVIAVGQRRPPATSAEAMRETTEDGLLGLILTSLDEDGAFDIVPIPLAGKSSEADCMVVASGRSTRHVLSVADKLLERIKAVSAETPRAEGQESADWVLIDAGDVIVHIFRPEVREFYQLEKMWLPAPEATARPAMRQ